MLPDSRVERAGESNVDPENVMVGEGQEEHSDRPRVRLARSFGVCVRRAERRRDGPSVPVTHTRVRRMTHGSLVVATAKTSDETAGVTVDRSRSGVNMVSDKRNGGSATARPRQQSPAALALAQDS